ncbi:RNA pseudouridine synthase 4, mitochondrial [Geodia barretti]|uniref:RNA pseudouridine synthase 4, mitochondrial n=1 Tax=Geodia barretti TaxID=519541 RepID=A0AA35XM22_GEOBA|nr:RNA pseudouridine synthase 4, mitochondrial [Geodia barretti]
MVQSAVIYRDGDMIALNKPPGLPVQGGSRVARHLDAMLDALRFDAADAPRLVHRLDRDTSGVLLLARHAAAARELTALFRTGSCKNSIGHWSLACRSRRRGGSTRRSRSVRWARASG